MSLHGHYTTTTKALVYSLTDPVDCGFSYLDLSWTRFDITYSYKGLKDYCCDARDTLPCDQVICITFIIYL